MAKSKHHAPIQPEYIRLPASGDRSPHTDLNRTALEIICVPRKENNFNPPVASKLFNPTGSKRYIRLINYQSLLAYLNKLPSDPPRPAQRPKVTTPRRKARKEPVNA